MIFKVNFQKFNFFSKFRFFVYLSRLGNLVEFSAHFSRQFNFCSGGKKSSSRRPRYFLPKCIFSVLNFLRIICVLHLS